MEFGEVVKTRRSVRDFDTSRDVPERFVKKIFELAELSPSSYNLQPWEFVIVRSAEKKERLKECAYGQSHVGTASLVIIVLGNRNPLKKAKKVAESSSSIQAENFKNVLKRIPPQDDFGVGWASKNVGLIASTLMLAAHNFGISSCPMEGFNTSKVREAFKIPENYEIPMLIALGYGNSESERGFRYGYETITHNEEYSEK